ncbi:MAG: hypothetical protein KKB50_02245 [Planctomycetes bacterium]|nr:hypothetical protein [Planctomycetota bacterium]
MIRARTTPRVKGNRLVEVTRRVDDETAVAAYEYLGDNRRASKTVTNCGTEEATNDGGNTTVHYYYANQNPKRQRGAGWSIRETRNGSSQTTAQWIWGTQYVDELVMTDVNGDPTESNDCDPDEQSGESTADARYFYHQDRNWNVVALSEYDTGETNNGRIVERYAYTPYGQITVLSGDSGSSELASVSLTSSLGNPFAHPGLPMDHEKGRYQNRRREYGAAIQKFTSRDPVHYSDGLSSYCYLLSRPTSIKDPRGLFAVGDAGDEYDPDQTYYSYIL